MQINLKVNELCYSLDIEPTELLVDLLRDRLKLRGTHVGCDTSQCGACVVDLNGRSVKSCTVLAAAADQGHVTTVEGLASADGQLHPIQRAFVEHHGLQCGFCTPGMLMSAADLLRHNPNPDETDVREWLTGNFCRCTGYQNIVKAVMAAARDCRDGASGVGKPEA